ncbi:MAG: glycosyltransferase, partial [Gluconacetobacter diazotrophicus]|nr:glycosyltransferase [Gluconacetobacter diazotrophicus]
DPALPARDEPASRRATALLAEINAAAAGRAGLAGAPFPSVPAFLRATRLSPRVLDLFDHGFYAHNVRDPRRTLVGTDGAVDRGACLVHFATAGIDALLPIRTGYAFEPDFYRQTYLGTLPLTDANSYRNWLNDGVARERWPNRWLFVRNLLGDAAGNASVLDLDLFAAVRNIDTERTAWADVLARFIDDGAADPLVPVHVTAENAAVLTLIADRMAVRGNHDKAGLVYERVLRAMPGFEPALYHYGDLLLRRSCHLAAAGVFEKLLAGPVPGIWAFINLSVCQERMGDPLAALRTLRRAISAFPGDQGLRRRFDELARQHLGNTWQTAAAEAGVDRLPDGQRRLADAYREVAELCRTGDLAAGRFVRAVALVGNTFLAQCRFYRIEQKIEQLRLAGYEVEFFDYERDLPSFGERIHRFQAAIFYRVPAFLDVTKAIDNARSMGLATFYEIDDPIFDAALYPPPFETYEGQVTPEEYAGLALGVPLFRQALALCDHAIASTPALARSMARVPRPDGGERRVFLHRNALGDSHVRAADVVRRDGNRDRVVIFYGSGTKAHKSDFIEFVEPALVEVARRHRDRLTIILAGHVALSEELRSIGDGLVLVEPTWEIERYWATLSVADISLAVLKPDPLTDTKSEIKWLEAAMLGIPSIVSDTATYRELLRSGEDAIICADAADWTAALDRLIRDPALRRRIGDAARRKAMSDYAPAAMAENLSRMLRSVSPPAPDRKPLVLVVNVYYPPQAIGGATRV